MARSFYSLLWYLLLPFTLGRLWWRGRREPGYREHVGERYGVYGAVAPAVDGEVVWVHAVSLGETRAAAPLLDRIARARPHARILLTHMTATGRDAGHALYGDKVQQAWLPYDVPFAVDAFLTHFRPRFGLLMETEVWPNLVAACHRRDIPLYLVNARLSEQSTAGYARFSALTRPMFAQLAGAAAQTPGDAARLSAVGAHDIAVTGNLKFDVALSAESAALGREFRLRFGESRPVFLAAATRDGEESLLLDAMAFRALPAQTLTVIVPRHPQRFESVADLLRARGIPFARRSDNQPVPADIAFVLGDSLGEMGGYYVAADVAFIGGSLKPLGGQNLIESIAVGTPTIVGMHTFNFREAADNAVAAGAALRVADADALMAQAGALLADPARRHSMRTAALAFHSAHRGAADRLWAWLAPRLPEESVSRSSAD
ncbi:MAG: lipid IV(A) 3-deoxy-D-manno-octulosonic acid transferase [Betaproteobacteria bacterium]